MKRDISVVGSGQTRFGELWDRSIKDIMSEAVDCALESSSCAALDIDMIVVANMLAESVSNQTHLGSLASSLLPHKPPALRVEAACASGAVAVHTACALLESRKVETVLVVGVEKMTDRDTETISEALMSATDAEHDQSSGLTFPGVFGLVANRYMHEFNLTREQLNLVSSIHHKNACGNPYAQFRNELSPEVVAASPLVADPLRLLDCSPVSDGAAACILSTAPAKGCGWKQGKIRIAASQIATDTLSLTQRTSITSFSATKKAMKKALSEAQIQHEDLSHIEMHDCFSIAALINMEDLGFADTGKGISFYTRSCESKFAAKRQSNRCYENITINQSGGLKACGHPVGATGVKQIGDVARQLRSSGHRFGLAHNLGGAGATCGIHILENTHA